MKRMIKVGHIDRAPDVYRVDAKDEIDVTIDAREGVVTVSVDPKGVITVRAWRALVVLPRAQNMVAIQP